MSLQFTSIERRKEIASMGGKSIKRRKTTFKDGSQAAVEAGRKGGLERAARAAARREQASLSLPGGSVDVAPKPC